MKLTPTEAIEIGLNIAPIDIYNGSNKSPSRNCGCIKLSLTKTKANGKQTTSLMHLTSHCMQLLMHLSKIYKPDFEQIIIPREISPIHEVFFIPNLTTVLPKEGESIEEYINNFQEGTSNKSIQIYTYGSAQRSYLYGN